MYYQKSKTTRIKKKYREHDPRHSKQRLGGWGYDPHNRDNKKNNVQMGLYQTKKFYTAKEKSSMKRKPTE